MQKLFLTDRRKRTGILLSVLGVTLNLLLFGVKYAGGLLSDSVAVTADAFNNLADTFSCIITLTGFWLGSKKPDKRFPMGWGRLEYLSGLVISAAILLIGGRMLLSSFDKILHPEPVDGRPAVLIILLISIAVKGVMYRYNSVIGKKLLSSAMKAAALDSLSDCFATLAILLSIIIERLTGFYADGWTGLLVALCILYAGCTSVKESAAPLLGKGLDQTSRKKLKAVLNRHEEIRRIDSLMLHDYGPNQKLLTFYLDAEGPDELIAVLRREIDEELHIQAVICPIKDE